MTAVQNLTQVNTVRRVYPNTCATSHLIFLAKRSSKRQKTTKKSTVAKKSTPKKFPAKRRKSAVDSTCYIIALPLDFLLQVAIFTDRVNPHATLRLGFLSTGTEGFDSSQPDKPRVSLAPSFGCG
jgi:hypothetical protein